MEKDAAEPIKLYNFNYLNKFSKNEVVLYRTEENSETVFTYGEVLAEAQKLVQCMEDSRVPQDIGIALNLKEHTPALCASLLGILNHNCFFCPLADHGFNETTTEHLRMIGARFIISDIKTSNDDTFKLMHEIKVFNETMFFYEISPTDDCHLKFSQPISYCICTSGSTGKPKAVYVPYKCISSNIDALSDILQITCADVIMLYAPISFDPFVIEFFLALRNGAAMIITNKMIRLNPDRLIRILFPECRKYRGASILQITPSLFRLFGSNISMFFDEKNPLRALVLGGEEFPTPVEWLTWLPSGSLGQKKRVFNIYGITEVSCWSTIHEFTFTEERIPIGKPIDSSLKLRILDAENREVSGLGRGELHIGSSERKCYLSGEDLVSKNSDVIYRRTGDLVERDENSNIFYIGRLKNVSKRFGKLLHTDQISVKIERILLGRVRVVCSFDEANNELVAFIASSNKDSLQERYRILIMEKLENFEKPDKILYVKEIPLTAHGKVDLAKLKQINSDARKTNPLDIFKSFLKDSLGIKLDEYKGIGRKRSRQEMSLSFLEAGGTSFNALSLATEIGKNFNNAEDNKTLLTLLLSESTTIEEIINFLSTVTIKNSKLIKDLPPWSDCRLELNFLWKANLGKCVDASPACRINEEQTYICVGSHSKIVLTLDGLNGEEIERVSLPDRVEGTVTFLTNNLALVGCYDGFLYAFDYLTGEVQWNFNAGGMIKSQSLILDDCVIVTSYGTDFNIYCIHLNDLSVKWKHRIGSKGILSTPITIRNSNLIVSSLDGTYACIDHKNGAIVWSKKLETPIFSNASKVFEGTQFIIAEVSGSLYICKSDDGSIITNFRADGNIFSGITTHSLNDNSVLILFGCHDHNIYCLKYSKENHCIDLHWKSYLQSPIYSTPKILKRNSKLHVLVCSTKGLVLILDLRTGFLVSKYQVNGEIYSTPCLTSDNKIYFGCRDDFVYCLGLKPEL